MLALGEANLKVEELSINQVNAFLISLCVIARLIAKTPINDLFFLRATESIRQSQFTRGSDGGKAQARNRE